MPEYDIKKLVLEYYKICTQNCFTYQQTPTNVPSNVQQIEIDHSDVDYVS